MPQATAAGVVLGTAGYMSPEQVRGVTADYRADIFAFGAVLYEMLTGQRAFGGETMMDVMMAAAREEAPPLDLVSTGPAAVTRARWSSAVWRRIPHVDFSRRAISPSRSRA